MVIDTFILGDFQTNCFCIRADEKAQNCGIIDPGLRPGTLLQFLQDHDLIPDLIVCTHGHVDHIAGIEAVREYRPAVQVAVHKEDADMLTDPLLNLSLMAGTMVQTRPADIFYDIETTVDIAGITFHLFNTPGHTPGGICLYSAQEGLAFVGDTLFAGGIGRSDFEGGNHSLLMQNITEKLLTLPDNTRIYPGHGPATTIGREKQFNPFLPRNV